MSQTLSRIGRVLLLVALVVGCGGGSENEDSLVANDDTSADFQPPSTISGRTYLLNINEGTGLFASSGSFLMRFSANQNTYERIAIAGVSSDASGSYSYSTSGTQGIATIDDSVLGRATIGLNFSGVRTGSYVVTAESDPESVHSGSFEQQGDVEEEETLDVPENTPTGVTSAGVPWNGEQPPAGTIITHNALWRDAAQLGDGTETTIYFTHDPRYSERRMNDGIVAFVLCVKVSFNRRLDIGADTAIPE